jgi:soluble lytic murein transglycosylase
MAFDEFVEEIPYSETRGYVKRVLRSFAAYQYLYESTSPAARVSMSVRRALQSPD